MSHSSAMRIRVLGSYVKNAKSSVRCTISILPPIFPDSIYVISCWIKCSSWKVVCCFPAGTLALAPLYISEPNFSLIPELLPVSLLALIVPNVTYRACSLGNSLLILQDSSQAFLTIPIFRRSSLA